MDSPLEGSGFEPSVPRQKGNGFEALSETGRSAGGGRRYHPSICPPSAEGSIWRAEIRRAQSIVPDLAMSWSWNEDGTELTFPLRQGVTWHDGKPFTAKDVVCTWDLLTCNSSNLI